MAFLYPLAWLGTVAVVVPIWLHLRRREESKLVRFSAMRFLEDQPVARRRPLWPHNWLLLLLRLAGLILLVAAFSWPYMPSAERIVIRESRVYILDNTLSHQMAGGVEKAADEILQALNDSGLETQIAVVELTNQPRVLVRFDDDRNEAIEKVKGVKPSFQRGSYLAAFRAANRLLKQSFGEKKRIVLLGDSQQNQWEDGLSTPPFLVDVEVTLPEVEPVEPKNLALSNPGARRLLSDNQATVECAVRLFHQGDIETAKLVFSANGEEVMRRDVPLGGQPEWVTSVARWEVDPSQWLRGEVRLEGNPDGLEADDRVVFSLPPVREGRVGLLSRSPFLQTALSPDIMQGRWKTRIANATNPAEEDADDDVFCLESSYLESKPVRGHVLECLRQGKGVVLLLDRVTPVISGFLRDLGVETLQPLTVANNAAGFRYVFMEHPVFQPFRSVDFGNLAEITIQRYNRLQAPTSTPLAFSQAGDPLILELDVAEGRLLILAFSLDRTDSNWPLHPTFIPFVDRCFQYARAETAVTTDFVPGEMCVWKAPADREVSEVVVQADDPQHPSETIRVPVVKGQARFRLPDAPGLYALSYDNSGELEHLLAVNPPAEESELKFSSSPKVVDAWKEQTDPEASIAESAGLVLDLSRAEILRQDLWWWLILVGTILLLLETAWLSVRKASP